VKALPKFEDKIGKVQYLFVGVSAYNVQGQKFSHVRVDIYEVETALFYQASIVNPAVTICPEMMEDMLSPLRIMPINGVFTKRKDFGHLFEPSLTKPLLTQTVVAKLEGQKAYVLVRPCEPDFIGKLVYRVGVYSGIGVSEGIYTDYDFKTMILRVYAEKGKKFDVATLGLRTNEVYLMSGLRTMKTPPVNGKYVLSLGGYFDILTMKEAVDSKKFTEEDIKQLIEEDQTQAPPQAVQYKRPRSEDVVCL
jgi:hypothetical protein